jgi:hypothetical protein
MRNSIQPGNSLAIAVSDALRHRLFGTNFRFRRKCSCHRQRPGIS